MPDTIMNFGGSGLTNLAKTLGNSIGDFATTTAQQAIQGVMGHNANLASAQGQANAMDFNSSQVSAANQQNIASMSNQYQFNAAQAMAANEFNAGMWQQAADWNERMWERQAEFNAREAEKQRDWQTVMANTQYQRAVGDMQSAGLNPILAVTGGGIGTGVPGGATASVGGASMGSAQAAMASGGLLGAEAGSVSGYQGQLEFTGGVLNLLASALAGMGTSAMQFGQLGDYGETLGKTLAQTVYGKENGEKAYNVGKAVTDAWGRQVEEKGLLKGTWDTVKGVSKAAYDTFTKKK